MNNTIDLEKAKQELEELKNQNFALKMQDRWTPSDYERNRRQIIRIRELEQRIEQGRNKISTDL